MSDEPSDTPPAEQLLTALKTARSVAGVSGVELARRSGYSQSTISRMERGELSVSMLAAARWAWYLRRPRAELRALVELARTVAEEKAGLVPIRVVLQHGAESVQRRIRLQERNVEHQSVFHPSIVPGLLQTDEYIRMVMQEGDPDVDVTELVAERQRRQRGAATRRITFVITEGCLEQGMPDAGLMFRQCNHLADIATSHQHWRLGVIPRLTAGTWPNITQNGFDLYDQQQVFIGTTAGNALARDHHTVAEHEHRFMRLMTLAVFGDAASAILRRIGDEYRELA